MLFEQSELERAATVQPAEQIKDESDIAAPPMPSSGGTSTIASAAPSVSTRVQSPRESQTLTQIALPDFSGLTARRAVALAREMGLRLSIADSDGELVVPERIPNVRVASDYQRPLAGTLVGPNDRVRIRVRGHYGQSVRPSIGY